ncbi:MAG: CotH kinase family protein [Fibromonadaceae bacterium]|jgi:hypothetical protein|nr:CotH kinase family protein [Fibromonadaceae bacterium]
MLIKLSLLSATIAVLQQMVFAQATLPVININTDNSVPIVSKVDWVTMTFSLDDPNDSQNNISAISNQQIRGRGNSSWNASWNRIIPADGINVYRNPYRIRFRNSQQQSPFGLAAARNWVLMNADIDKNAFGLEMGKRLDLQYTCSYNFVEAYVNNGYSGKYILTEHRQADPAYIGAPGRPKAHPTEGWFIEVDRYFPEDEPVKFRTENYNLPVTIKSPSFSDDIDDPRYDFVKNDLNEITNLMASNDFPENGYRDLVDAETFIKYFLVQTFIQNVDLFRRGSETGENIGSAFFYKDKGGKISAGPLWDLNWSFQEFSGSMATQFGNMGPTHHPYVVYPWLRRFLDDPEFLVRYKEIWNEKMPQIESMRSFIAEMLEKLHGALATDNLTRFYDRRLTFLKAEYDKVNVRPTARSFGTRGYDYLQALPRDITLVSYGEMSGLSASLQKGASSDFEIVSNLSQTSTGKGGYLAAISVKPKDALAAASYSDVLILSGAKQGNEFTFEVPLSFVVSSAPESVSVLPQFASGNKVIPVKNGMKLTAATNATIQVYNATGRSVASYAFTGGVHNVSLNHLPYGVYVAKVSLGSEHKIMRVVVR